MKRRTVLQLAAAGVLPGLSHAAAQPPLKELRLDYAY